MRNFRNGLPVQVKIVVSIMVFFDLLGFVFLKQSYSIYKEKYEFLAILWFGLGLFASVIELAVVLPFFKLKDWARRALIGTSCYSVFSSFRLLIYTVVNTMPLTAKAAFVGVVAGFIAFLVTVTIPTLLIYFLQSPKILKKFGRNDSEPRGFLLFDFPFPKSQQEIKVKRLMAAGMDLILYPLTFGILMGIGFLGMETSPRQQVLFWANLIGNALILRDYVFSPGRYFFGLRLVTISNEASVMMYSPRFVSNLVRVVLRNLFLLIPFVLIVGYVFEIIMVLITGNRFSDRIAGTMVIRNRNYRAIPGAGC